MGLITDKPLSVIKSEVGGLFRALDTQTKACHDAAGGANSLTSALNSTLSTDVIRIHTLKAQLDEAKGTKAGASKEVNSIEKKIMQYRGELNGLLKDVYKAIEILKKDLMKIKEAYEALRLYNKSLVPMRKGRDDLKKFIRDISESLDRHQRKMLGFSVSSGKTNHLDDLVAETKINTKNTLNNYGPSTTAAYTAHDLDAELPGKAFYLLATDYIPNLNPSGNQRLDDISDKIRLGSGYTPKGNHSNYQIKLSNHLDRILQGKYSSKYGVYSAQMY